VSLFIAFYAIKIVATSARIEVGQPSTQQASLAGIDENLTAE
jgi:hypothetical protein